MRALLVAAGGILLINAVNPAGAADISSAAPRTQPPGPLPIYNWTGFYVGGNFGGGWVQSDFTVTRTGTVGAITLPSATTSGSSSGSGILGGGQIGFNYALPSYWILGIEADLAATDISSSGSFCATTPSGIVAACADRHTKLDDFNTVRGRLGYAFNNLLVYGTGGWAWGRGTATHTVTCIGLGCPGTSLAFARSGPPFSVEVNSDGWTAGAGVEWGFLPNWTLRAEYLHLQFDGVREDASITGTTPFGFPVSITRQVTEDSSIDIVRIAVNYIFNWGPPSLMRQ